MFRDLEKYYSTGSVDLTASLKQFFSLLYKKMFQELNSQYDFDAAYLECTVENMEEMMPFGEMPQKLILQIKRSFIAIRTFVQALNYGSQVLKTIMDVSERCPPPPSLPTLLLLGVLMATRPSSFHRCPSPVPVRIVFAPCHTVATAPIRQLASSNGRARTPVQVKSRGLAFPTE